MCFNYDELSGHDFADDERYCETCDEQSEALFDYFAGDDAAKVLKQLYEAGALDIRAAREHLGWE